MEDSSPPAGEKPHSELRLVDAAAFSVGLIGPVGAIGLLGTGAALIIGRAVTLSFVFAIIGAAKYGAGLPFTDLGQGYIGEWYATS